MYIVLNGIWNLNNTDSLKDLKNSYDPIYESQFYF